MNYHLISGLNKSSSRRLMSTNPRVWCPTSRCQAALYLWTTRNTFLLHILQAQKVLSKVPQPLNHNLNRDMYHSPTKEIILHIINSRRAIKMKNLSRYLRRDHGPYWTTYTVMKIMKMKHLAKGWSLMYHVCIEFVLIWS